MLLYYMYFFNYSRKGKMSTHEIRNFPLSRDDLILFVSCESMIPLIKETACLEYR
uniref:Uncharacterized protein n=1 Tax=Lepeophtheirus salmonis TaxID=72036 RepID=A0A0K2U6K7_LEPSM